METSRFHCPRSKLADLVELLVVHRDPHAPRLLRDDHQRARIWRGGVLDQPIREVLIKGCVHFFGQNRVYSMGPGSDRASRNKTQSPSSRWRTHRETRTAHHPVVRWPGGSSQGHVSQTQSPAGGAAVGPRRARTKNAGLDSVVPVAPARAAPRPGLPHLCQENSLQLKPGSSQTGQGGVPQRGWRVARH